MSNGNGQGPTLAPVIDARAWRRASKEGEYFTLPGNGQPAKLKRPTFMALAAQAAYVPNKMANEVAALLSQAQDFRDRSLMDQIEQYKKNSRGFILIAAECFVEPRLVIDLICQECHTTNAFTATECTNCHAKRPKLTLREPDYDNGEIGPDDLGDFNYTWLVYSFVEGTDERVRPFRLSGSAGEITSRSEGVQSEAV